MRSRLVAQIDSSSSTIWLASSRVGARTRARGAVARLDQVDDRDPKASVLPEPVGD